MGRRRVRILTVLLIIVGIIAVALATLVYFTNQKLNQSNLNAGNMKTVLDENTLTGVYIAKTDIHRGDTLIDDIIAEAKNSNDPSEARDEETAGAIITSTAVANVYQGDIYTSLGRNSYISSEQLGAVAIVDIPEGTPIMANMVEAVTITQDTREYEIMAVNLMVDQQDNDIIDVRIAYPNGEEFTVLSKKKIENLSLAHADFRTYMTENEMLTYRSAVCDAYQTTGAYLYAVRYVESNLQEGATVNYLVRSETIDLIRSDPNIYETAEQTMNASARMALEVRLGQLTEDQLAAIADGLSIADTAKNAVLVQNVDNNSAQISAYGLNSGINTPGTTSSNNEQEENADSQTTDTQATAPTEVDQSLLEDNEVIATPFVNEGN